MFYDEFYTTSDSDCDAISSSSSSSFAEAVDDVDRIAADNPSTSDPAPSDVAIVTDSDDSVDDQDATRRWVATGIQLRDNPSTSDPAPSDVAIVTDSDDSVDDEDATRRRVATGIQLRERMTITRSRIAEITRRMKESGAGRNGCLVTEREVKELVDILFVEQSCEALVMISAIFIDVLG